MKTMSKTSAYKLASKHTVITGRATSWQVIAPANSDRMNGATRTYGNCFYYRDAVKARKRTVALLAAQLMTDVPVAAEVDYIIECTDMHDLSAKGLLDCVIAELAVSHHDFTC